MRSLAISRHNTDGQLGLGDAINRGNAANEMGDALPFVNFGACQTALILATGAYHTCVTLSDGIKCWGCVSLELSSLVPYSFTRHRLLSVDREQVQVRLT